MTLTTILERQRTRHGGWCGYDPPRSAGVSAGATGPDDVVIDNMRAKLAAHGYRFSNLVETIVTSPQFLTRRVPDDPTMQ